MKNPAAFLGTERLYNIYYLLSNSEKSVIILFMKRKIIIGIACALLAVCTAVGAFQHLKNSSSKEVTELSSTDITVQETAESEIPSEETVAVSPTDLPAETSTVAKTQKKIETSSAERKTENKKPAVPASQTTERITEKSTEAEKIKVTFSVNSTRAHEYGADVPEYIIPSCSYTVKNGTTAFDILNTICRERGVLLEYQSKNYILSIGGLKEKDCGTASGWMYSINGQRPPKPASKYVLQSGDVIEWYYVTSTKD